MRSITYTDTVGSGKGTVTLHLSSSNGEVFRLQSGHSPDKAILISVEQLFQAAELANEMLDRRDADLGLLTFTPDGEV